jgi:hypothetical protein
MFNLTLSTPLSFLISLAALAGIVVHDTKVSRLATTFSALPAIMSTADDGSRGLLSNETHPHVERINLSEVRNVEPGLAPRVTDQKKHMMQRNIPKGGHRYDGYVLPLG